MFALDNPINKLNPLLIKYDLTTITNQKIWLIKEYDENDKNF